jgi:hypothetical protein
MSKPLSALPAALALLGIVGLSAVLIIGFNLILPAGLPSRAVTSVPTLLSEPGGVPGSNLVLAPHGLGPVTFGTPETAAVADFTRLLGAPVEDAPGPCTSRTDVVRWVRWGNLSAAFPHGHFGGYVIGIYFPPDSPELPIKTAAKVGLRARVEELSAAFGNRLGWYGQDASGFSQPVDTFGIDGYDPKHPTPTGLGGYVEGGRKTGRVITFLAGQPCGPSTG